MRQKTHHTLEDPEYCNRLAAGDAHHAAVEREASHSDAAAAVFVRATTASIRCRGSRSQGTGSSSQVCDGQPLHCRVLCRDRKVFDR